MLQNLKNFPEEIFGTNNALWFSKDGTKLAYVTFDDTNVRIMRVPHYGVPGSVDAQYTKHHDIRYPKVRFTYFSNLLRGYTYVRECFSVYLPF